MPQEQETCRENVLQNQLLSMWKNVDVSAEISFFTRF